MKEIVICLLFFSMLLTACSVKDSEGVNTIEDNKPITAVTEENENITTDDEENNEAENSDELEEEVQSKRQAYLDKYSEIETELKVSLEEKYNGTTVDMREAAATELESWDDFLNEVYGVLQLQLPEDEMNVVREEQIQWLTIRDSKAEESAKEVEGGTMEPLVYEISLGQSTKERSYELIVNYMK